MVSVYNSVVLDVMYTTTYNTLMIKGVYMAVLSQRTIRRLSGLKLDNFVCRGITVRDPLKYELY